MARTPKPPKLKGGGFFNGLHIFILILVTGLIAVPIGLPWLILITLGNLSGQPASFQLAASEIQWIKSILTLGFIALALATPAFWRLVLRFLQWGFSDFSPKAIREGFLGKLFRNYKNRKTLSWSDHYRLRYDLNGFLLISFAIIITATAIYITFNPWGSILVGWVGSGWVLGILLLASYFIFFITLIGIPEQFGLFENLSAKLVGEHADNLISVNDENPITGQGEKFSTGNPAAENKPHSDEFAYNPAAFGETAEQPSKQTSDARKLEAYQLRYLNSRNEETRENAREQILALGGEIPEQQEDGAPFKGAFPFKPTAIDELAYVADYAPEKLTHEERREVYDYAKKVEWPLPKLFAIMDAENEAEDLSPVEKDGHHPDDAAIWEVVNDAKSTSEERKTALEMIMEREAGRSRRD